MRIIICYFTSIWCWQRQKQKGSPCSTAEQSFDWSRSTINRVTEMAWPPHVSYSVLPSTSCSSTS